MDTDVILCIIALSAIISPVLVTFMNNSHDYAVRRLELITKNKQDILYNFSKAVNQDFKNNDNVLRLFQAINLLYIYFDVNDKLLEEITDNCSKKQQPFDEDVINFIKDLSKQIDK